MLENFSNTILAGNFGIVCEKLSKKSTAQSLTAWNNCSLITRDGDGQPQNRLSIAFTSATNGFAPQIVAMVKMGEL